MADFEMKMIDPFPRCWDCERQFFEGEVYIVDKAPLTNRRYHVACAPIGAIPASLPEFLQRYDITEFLENS